MWQGEGRLAEADQALADVQAQYAKRQAQTGVVVEVGITRSEIALAQGHIPQARMQAEQALAMARKAQGDLPQSFLTGRAWLVLARCEHANGAQAAASEAIRRAGEQLRPTLGAQHPVTRDAERLAAAWTR